MSQKNRQMQPQKKKGPTARDILLRKQNNSASNNLDFIKDLRRISPNENHLGKGKENSTTNLINIPRNEKPSNRLGGAGVSTATGGGGNRASSTNRHGGSTMNFKKYGTAYGFNNSSKSPNRYAGGSSGANPLKNRYDLRNSKRVRLTSEPPHSRTKSYGKFTSNVMFGTTNTAQKNVGGGGAESNPPQSVERAPIDAARKGRSNLNSVRYDLGMHGLGGSSKRVGGGVTTKRDSESFNHPEPAKVDQAAIGMSNASAALMSSTSNINNGNKNSNSVITVNTSNHPNNGPAKERMDRSMSGNVKQSNPTMIHDLKEVNPPFVYQIINGNQSFHSKRSTTLDRFEKEYTSTTRTPEVPLLQLSKKMKHLNTNLEFQKNYDKRGSMESIPVQAKQSNPYGVPESSGAHKPRTTKPSYKFERKAHQSNYRTSNSKIHEDNNAHNISSASIVAGFASGISPTYVGELEKNLGEVRMQNGQLLTNIAGMEVNLEKLEAKNENLVQEIDRLRERAQEV